MYIISNVNNFFKALVNRNKPKLVNAFFMYFMFAFTADQLVNYFVHVPVFVVAALAIFPLLILFVLHKNHGKLQLIVFILSFILIAVINNAVYGLHKKNISDLLFICLFAAFYYLYRNRTGYLKVGFVYAFFFIFLALFSFTFLSINSGSVFKTTSTLSIDSTSVAQAKPLSDTITPASEPIQWENNPRLDYVEYLRLYHNGLFRLPHMASYFFGFLSLFFIYRFWKNKKIIELVLFAISLIVCVYTGSRAVIAAFFLSGILFLLKRKYIVYLQSIIIAALLITLGIEHILRFTEGTVFYQYFSIIQTTTENITRLSRFRIWYSWWIEISNFGIWDFLMGKSYINAHMANIKNLNYDIWFHNDFLNIFFSYGIWATILYIGLFVKIYSDNKTYIKTNFFIFIYYFSMLITAIINGFYYYFPIFLLYLFWLMINEEKQTT